MIQQLVKISLVILTILCFVCSDSIAQGPWQGNSATWYYSHNNLAYAGYLKYEKQGDTLLNNILCDLIQRTTYGYSYWSSTFVTFSDSIYTYKSQDTVYLFFNNQFKILYIYNSQAGDSWPVQVGGGCTSGYFTVDSVTSIVINQDTLEKIYGRYVINTFPEISSSIIEKIGDVVNLIPDLVCFLDNYMTDLRCYSDSVNITFSTNLVPTCDFTIGVNDPDPSSIKIFPNPVTDKLNILSDLDEIKEIKIMDALGKEILTFQNNPKQIDIHELSAGIYFIEIKNQKGVFVKKIIKQ